MYICAHNVKVKEHGTDRVVREFEELSYDQMQMLEAWVRQYNRTVPVSVPISNDAKFDTQLGLLSRDLKRTIYIDH